MHPLFLREGQKVVAFWGGFLPQDRFTHPELTNANSTLPPSKREGARSLHLSPHRIEQIAPIIIR